MNLADRLRRLWIILLLGAAVVMTACAPGTDGLRPLEIAEDGPKHEFGSDPISIELPAIPAVVLPDLSHIGNYGDLFEERVVGLDFQPIDGVEVIEGDCTADDVVHHIDETSSVFDDAGLRSSDTVTYTFDPATERSIYTSQDRRVTRRIESFPDGSGEFVEIGRDHRLSIIAAADGSGTYYAEQEGLRVTVEADPQGLGTYTRRAIDQDTGAVTITTVTLEADGSGEYVHDEPGRTVSVDVNADGTGEYFYEADERTVTVRLNADGSWEYRDASFGNAQAVHVAADGTGRFHDRSPERTLKLNFDEQGNSHRYDVAGPPILVPDAPVFEVADRFPQLGTLAYIEPPCIAPTVLRFDSALLFADNDYAVLPDAQAVLAELAPALIEANQPFEVNGHTDARGTDEHNQELSDRRALEVANELFLLGVPAELMSINGFGESQPVAPNFTDDGEDDEAGQAQNRRVEIVIGNQETT